MRSLKSLFLMHMPSCIVDGFKKVHYLKLLKSFDQREEEEISVVLQLARAGECVVDIGANVGWYTKVLSELVGPHGQVFSIEPVPDTFSILRYCVKKLGLSNVQLFNYALSNKNGTMSMSVPSFESGGYNFYQARLVSDELISDQLQAVEGKRLKSIRKYENVGVRTLDSLMANVNRPITFIKCDVEGHELSVIEGSRNLLTRWLPAWLIEVAGNPDTAGSSASQLFDIFRAAGYEPWVYKERQLRKRKAGDKAINYFFLQTSHFPLVQSLLAPSE